MLYSIDYLRHWKARMLAISASAADEELGYPAYINKSALKEVMRDDKVPS